MIKEGKYETDVSAKQTQKSKKSWIPEKDVHQRGSENHQTEARQGKKKACVVNGWAVRRRPDFICGNRVSRGCVLVRNTFSKSDRILKRYEYVRLSGSANRAHNRYFVAVYDAGAADRTRLGITVTKKVGGAAARNKIKRRVREYFRTNRDSIAQRLDINIIAKKDAVALSARSFLSSLQSIFSKISLRQ